METPRELVGMVQASWEGDYIYDGTEWNERSRFTTRYIRYL